MHLPDALGLEPALANRVLGGAELGDVGACVCGGFGRGQPALRLFGRGAPERPGLVGHQPVHLGRDLVPVVGVVGLVHDVGRDEFPHQLPRGLPGGAVQIQPRGRAGGIAEVEVKPDQNAVATLPVIGQDGGQQGLALGARGDIVGLCIESETHVALGHADPQRGVAQLLGFGGGPVGDDIGVEKAGQGGLLDKGVGRNERGF